MRFPERAGAPAEPMPPGDAMSASGPSATALKGLGAGVVVAAPATAVAGATTTTILGIKRSRRSGVPRG